MARTALIATLLLVVGGGVLVFMLLDEDDPSQFDVAGTSSEEAEVSGGARRDDDRADDAPTGNEFVAPAAPTGGVAGRVTDVNGKPVAGARVTAGPIGRKTGGFVLTATIDPERERTTATDADGRYVIEGCDVGEVVVVAASDVHPAVIRRGVSVVEDEVVDEVDFSLRGGRRIEGIVVDDLGDPVAGAFVKLNVVTFGEDPLVARWAPRSTTGADGRFSIGCAEQRLYRASVTCAGHLPPRPINVHETDGEVRLEMTRCGRVAVIVVAEESGAPIPGAVVANAREGGMKTAVGERAVEITGESLPDHTVLVYGLTSRSVSLRVSAGGRASRVLSVRELGPGEVRRLEVTLQPEMKLAGRVESRAGKRLAGATVTVVGRAGFGRDTAFERGIVDGKTGDLDDRAAQNDRNALVRESVETDGEGRFRVHGLPPGNFRVSVTHPRHLPARERAVTLDEELPVEDIVVRLREGGRVRVTVTSAGRPAAGAWVVVCDPTPDPGGDRNAVILFNSAAKVHGRARCDARGEATVYGIPPGEYDVLASLARGDDPDKWALLDGAGRGVRVTLKDGQVENVALSLP